MFRNFAASPFEGTAYEKFEGVGEESEVKWSEVRASMIRAFHESEDRSLFWPHRYHQSEIFFLKLYTVYMYMYKMVKSMSLIN
jgi:hypothetical protein